MQYDTRKIFINTTLGDSEVKFVALHDIFTPNDVNNQAVDGILLAGMGEYALYFSESGGPPEATKKSIIMGVGGAPGPNPLIGIQAFDILANPGTYVVDDIKQEPAGTYSFGIELTNQGATTIQVFGWLEYRLLENLLPYP